MRMPRITVRTMMIAVAVIGVGLSVVELDREARYRWSRALDHARRYVFEERVDCGLVVDCSYDACWACSTPPEIVTLRSRTDPGLDYHHRMKHKWLRAARNPWLSVEPDPPVPE